MLAVVLVCPAAYRRLFLCPIAYRLFEGENAIGVMRRTLGLTSLAIPSAGRATPGHYDPGACGCKGCYLSALPAVRLFERVLSSNRR